MALLRRYWIRFAEDTIPRILSVPGILAVGCGVTAFDKADAVGILKSTMFRDSPIPKIVEFIEDIDVSELDPRHVLPNMGLVVRRGVWFPLGYGSA
jgi:hypothetical protein